MMHTLKNAVATVASTTRNLGGVASIALLALGAAGCAGEDPASVPDDMGSISAHIEGLDKSGDAPVYQAFTVEIAGHGFLPIKEKSGGDLVCDGPEGICAPGEAPHISELELVAFVTPNQQHFADIAKKVAIAGEQYRIDITVENIAAPGSGPSTLTIYEDCILHAYDLPRLADRNPDGVARPGVARPGKVESGSEQLMTETATFLPTRRRVVQGELASQGGDRRLTDAGFHLDIKGIGDMPNVRSADLGELTMEIVESTQGDEPELSYGEADWAIGAISLQPDPANQLLADWVAQAKENPDDPALRRDISVFLMRGTSGRTWSAKECFPTSFSPGGLSKDGQKLPAVLRFEPAHVVSFINEGDKTPSDVLK